MDKPKCWVKNVIKRYTVESYIFNLAFGFVNNTFSVYLTQMCVKTTQHCLECVCFCWLCGVLHVLERFTREDLFSCNNRVSEAKHREANLIFRIPHKHTLKMLGCFKYGQTQTLG